MLTNQIYILAYFRVTQEKGENKISVWFQLIVNERLYTLIRYYCSCFTVVSSRLSDWQYLHSLHINWNEYSL